MKKEKSVIINNIPKNTNLEWSGLQMNEKLYDLMDWPKIEALEYAECDNPHSILGAHVTKDGILVQGFFPTAVSVVVKTEKNQYTMERMDEDGLYAVLLPRKKVVPYVYRVTYDNEETEEFADPYLFAPVIEENDLKRFNVGICYDIYNKLGAHPMEINGVKGVLFAVWAPMAIRVSVVGDFNLWDGRRHPMRRREESGVHELFIPGLKEGQIYKYEIKTKGNKNLLKSDPYGNLAELRPNTASVICDINRYQWSDLTWMERRKKEENKKTKSEKKSNEKKQDIEPMSVYELHLGSWKKPEDGREFYNYREIAEELKNYVKEMGYTHVELMPVMEHPFDASWGYQVSGYYAPTSRYGTPEDFMYFVDCMHKNGIGVILDWVPAHFPRDTFGLAEFDGTCLYEHKDPRKGSHPHWGTLIYNYTRPEVSNFLIANAMFWADKYHIDGIRMDAVASMLYLDYGKRDGEWIPNMYGGKENLDAVEFFKHLNSMFKEKYQGVMLIAEESTAWPKVTGAVEEDGLGFDYKWNMGWMNDTLEYMKLDPLYRSNHYYQLTFSMIYAYTERFILSLSHDEVVHGKGSLIGKMFGETLEQKAASLRALYGYMMTHPGRKLLFMGQDIGQVDEWSEEKSIQWNLLEYDLHCQIKEYVKALNELYRSNPALYELDDCDEGFEWINCISTNENILAYVRRAENLEDMLLVIVNFSGASFENRKFGVPAKGKYKEIFNSDSEKFGGSGFTNPRLKQAKKEECDGREYSITLKVPPMGITVLKYSPAEEEVVDNKAAKTKREKAGKKTTAGKAQVDQIRDAIIKDGV